MKKICYGLFILIIFILMLLFPNTVITGASQGLLLWFRILLPTLLPFMLISRLLIKTGLVRMLSGFLYPAAGRLFGTTPEGAYCVLIGFLCGYPMGAKAICDLYREKAFSKEHAEYLLCFCNNVSPGFVSGFILNSCLNNNRLMTYTFLILYGTAFLISLLLRKFPKNQSSFRQAPTFLRISFSDITFADWNDCIQDSLASICMLGGYVIVFRILTQFLLQLFVRAGNIRCILAGIIEITAGIPLLASGNFTFPLLYSMIMACTAFGGLSGAAQTWGIIKPCRLSLSKYITCKIIQAILAGLIGYFLCCLL